MTEHCPRCHMIWEGDCPRSPHWVVYVCSECGYSIDEDGCLLNEGDAAKQLFREGGE